MANIPSALSNQFAFDFYEQSNITSAMNPRVQPKSQNQHVASLIKALSLDILSIKDLDPPKEQAMKIVWSDDDIDKLRTGFFHENIRLLADKRTGAETREENYEWLMSDDKHPFSFLVLCREEMLDPERIRNGVLATMKKCGIGIF